MPQNALSFRKDVKQMTLPNDPAILLSVINTKLRDFYPSLDALCDDLEADRRSIEEKCRTIGYEYDAARNQFV